jgi:hypothetical protein
MSTHTTAIVQVSAYRRIVAAGYDVKISHYRGALRIKLMRSAEVAALADCPRNGNLSVQAILEKAKLNTFGPTSGVYKALQQLADIAEANAAAGV